MLFYIVTPTFNALPWLERCVRSVADQAGEGVQVHHHVQDGGSRDGSPGWLADWQARYAGTPGYTFTYESGRDDGMYDAINRAWAKLPPEADMTAHLNSDEQYLPGALAGIAEAMRCHPEAEIALGTYLVLDIQSHYICHRRPILPHRWSSQTVCEIITCSCFHRAEPFRRHGIRFNARWRAIADVIFYRDLVETAPRFLVLPELFTSCFTLTGQNLAWSQVSRNEWQEVLEALPWHVSRRHGFAYRWCNLKRRLVDARLPAPVDYGIYLPGQEKRTAIPIQHPTCRWKLRDVGEEWQQPEESPAAAAPPAAGRKGRILLSAYSFGAYRGSETGVGWNIARGLALRGYEVTVLTTPEFHRLNTEAIRQEKLPLQLQEYDFGLQVWSAAATYYQWQRCMRPVVRQLAAGGGYDLFYQVNWNQYRGLCVPFGLPIPSMAGPLGGAETIPRSLLGRAGGLPWRQRLKEWARYAGLDALPLRWRNRKGNVLLLASNPVTAERLRHWGGCRRVEVCPAIAVDAEEIRELPDGGNRRDIVFDGGTRPEKGAALFLAALARADFKGETVRVLIPGIRPERQAAWQRMARQAGLPEGVSLGLLPFVRREEMLGMLRQCRLFASAAYRDSGGMGILEAVACGAQVLCLDIPSQFWLPGRLACKVPVRGSFKELMQAYAGALSEAWQQGAQEAGERRERRLRFLRETMTWDARLDTLEQLISQEIKNIDK